MFFRLSTLIKGPRFTATLEQKPNALNLMIYCHFIGLEEIVHLNGAQKKNIFMIPVNTKEDRGKV